MSINIARDGSVLKDGKPLYTPGSPVYESFHQLEGTGPANILLYSRRGSGKSWAARWFLHRCAFKFPGFRYLVTRNSLPELRKTHLQYLDNEMDLLDGNYAKVEGQANYKNGSSGIYAGFETEKDALKLIGADLDCVLVEEGTTVSWPVIISLASSLRTTKSSGRTPQLIIPTNPYGPSAIDIKRHWIDQDITEAEEPGYDPADWYAIRTTADDNPYLDFKTYDKRLGALPPAQRKAWLLGEWSSAEGSYFDDFEPEREGQPWHVISRLPEFKPGTLYYRAFDFGFSPDPAVCLWFAIDASGQITVLKERQWLRTPAAEVAHEITGNSHGMTVAQTFCDPTVFNGSRAGATSIGDVIEQEGIALTPSINDRSAAGLAVHEALSSTINGKPRIQIWREGCPNLIRTLPLIQANATHPDRIADGDDHWVLCVAYFLLGAGPLVKGHPVAGPPKKHPWMNHTGREVLGSESVNRR